MSAPRTPIGARARHAGVPTLCLLSWMALACTPASAPTAPSPNPPQTPAATSLVAGCEVSGSAEPGPMVGEPKSPYYDHLGLARSANGDLATQFSEVLAHASAPDATRLPDGGLGVYFHNGQTGAAVWLAHLSGTSLTPVAPITVDGVERPRWLADPNVDLVGGRVRMVYLNGSQNRRRFCVAESTDGIRFTTRALAIEFAGTEADPTVVPLEDGSWLMAYSRENHTGIGFARSTDGLTFTPYATSTIGTVPELAVMGDGRVRLYVCAAGGVEAHVSADRGVTWRREGTVITHHATGRAIICDTSYVPSEGLFVFKVTDAR